MIKKTLMAGALLAAFVGAQASTLNAGADYIVETTGTYSSDGTYMNFGLVASQYKSFVVFDFDGTSLGTVGGVTSATLNMQESDYTSTSSVPVTLSVYAVTDNVTSLANGQTTVEYNGGVLGGYTNQLGTPTLLGSFVFNPSGLTNGGDSDQTDTINLTTGLSSIAGLIDSTNHDIRLLVTTNETGEVTMAGSGSASAYIPNLVMQTTGAPEPASLGFLGLGIVGLIARKRRK